MGLGRLLPAPLKPRAIGRYTRAIGQLRRPLLVLRLKVAARLVGATVEVDIRPGVIVGRGVDIEIGPHTTNKVTVLAGSRLDDGVRLRLRGGEVHLGETVDVRAGAVLNIGGGTFRCDGENNLSWGVVIHCAESIHLHRFCHVAEFATIVDSSHYYSGPDEWSYHNTKSAPIVLEKDVWVCPKATITSGVTIGDHTIVASNSVVIRDAPGGVLLSGVPATVVNDLGLDWRTGAVTPD